MSAKLYLSFFLYKIFCNKKNNFKVRILLTLIILIVILEKPNYLLKHEHFVINFELKVL
jgi:hypothetical protein